MFSYLSEVDFVVEVESKEARMVVRSLESVAVFSARVIAEGTESLPEALKEFLKVCLLQTPVFGKVLLVIRERDERVLSVKRSFVDAALCPLCGSREAALHALAARDF